MPFDYYYQHPVFVVSSTKRKSVILHHTSIRIWHFSIWLWRRSVWYWYTPVELWHPSIGVWNTSLRLWHTSLRLWRTSLRLKLSPAGKHESAWVKCGSIGLKHESTKLRSAAVRQRASPRLKRKPVRQRNPIW